jgi:hypothetical protein
MRLFSVDEDEEQSPSGILAATMQQVRCGMRQRRVCACVWEREAERERERERERESDDPLPQRCDTLKMFYPFVVSSGVLPNLFSFTHYSLVPLLPLLLYSSSH